MNPLVSVIVPVFNVEPFLAEALESVLAQDYRPLEIIVTDDGSTDGSAAVASSFPEVTLLRQENLGCAAARNACLAMARGEVISLLDGDDIWLQGKLSCEMRHFAEHPETGYTLCHHDLFLSPGETAPAWFRPKHTRKVFSISPYVLAVRRSVFETVGPFNARLLIGEDIDWFMRAREAGVQMHVLDPMFVSHRVHSASVTANIPKIRQGLLNVAKLSIERRRAQSA
jgi:glycosyltransferase involved in cell wall biosynthesis